MVDVQEMNVPLIATAKWLPRLCQRLLSRRCLPLFSPSSLCAPETPKFELRACVRAQIILLLRRWRARAGRARAASSLYFFRSLSHALIPLPPPPSYSDRGRDFCQLRDRFKTQDALFRPGGRSCNPRQKQAARRGGCNQSDRARPPSPSPEIARWAV